jgi:hypothetical protein
MVWNDEISEATLNLDGYIKKNSGGDPFFIGGWTYDFNNPSQSQNGNGSFASSGAKVLLQDGSSATGCDYVEVERVDNSNELCFRFKWNADVAAVWSYQILLTGPKSYSGTDITSSNGTLF